MNKFWNNMTFFWKVYLSAIVLIISVVFIAELAEDVIPYITDYRRMNRSDLEAMLDEYVAADAYREEVQERLAQQGVWLMDVQLAIPDDIDRYRQGEFSIIDILPESDDWTEDWVIVDRLLPDGRVVALGLPEPAYSDLVDALLWLAVIAAFAGAACYYLSKFLSSRLSNISSATKQLAAGDMKTRVNVAGEGGDEISELGRLFNKMARSVELAMENERRLLYDISHELRSPLARMHLSVDLLRRGEQDKARQYLGILEDDITRMTVIMDAIMEQGKSSFVPGEFVEPFDLAELLAEAIELANFEVQKHGKSSRCALTARNVPSTAISGSRSLIEQAVNNLLSNALRYSPDGANVDVLLEARPAQSPAGGPEQLAITVRDYGPGVPDESLEKLFRPFFRVEDARDKNSGGVGLGLALASQYVKRHKGGISAKNCNPGLAVTIVLPVNASVQSQE